MKKDKARNNQWEKGWDGHRKAQLLRLSRLPFIEKLKWLDEAQDMIAALRKNSCKPFRK